MNFNQDDTIFWLNSKPLKLVDHLTHQGSNIPSTESNVNIHIGKAIEMLSIIWKSDLSDKIKREFFQAVAVTVLLYVCTAWTLMKHLEKKVDAVCCFEPIPEAAPHKTAVVWPLTSHHTNHPSKMNKTYWALLEM